MAFERNSINALALGVNRDVDGTVDRVAEPPYEIWKMLAFLQRKCETENIEIISVFEVSVAWSCMYLLLLRRACHTASHIFLQFAPAQEQGGNQKGVIKREKFNTALKDNFTRCYFRHEDLAVLTSHCARDGPKRTISHAPNRVSAHSFALSRSRADGVGYTDPRGNKEEVAWKDFCEDLLTAHEHIRPGTPDFDAVEEAKGKGHIPGKGQLPQVVMGWQPGQK